ncbi:unnamed protein product [Allacma fusca]|uniref:Uncharacterized protein n=1 Tax=Allacma fusca TaxID=39272 RepID=A0A8J2KFR9_9HEXA|nr:unnamed protein product [Allacma fusca]
MVWHIHWLLFIPKKTIVFTSIFVDFNSEDEMFANMQMDDSGDEMFCAADFEKLEPAVTSMLEVAVADPEDHQANEQEQINLMASFWLELLRCTSSLLMLLRMQTLLKDQTWKLLLRVIQLNPSMGMMIMHTTT